MVAEMTMPEVDHLQALRPPQPEQVQAEYCGQTKALKLRAWVRGALKLYLLYAGPVLTKCVVG